MAITTLTISSTTFDVYNSRAEVDAYVLGAILPAGVVYTTDSNRKDKLIVQATRILETLVWAGARFDTDTPQPLQWPRTGLSDRDGLAIDGTTPQDVLSAHAELCIFMDINGPAPVLQGTDSYGVKRTVDRVEGAVTEEREYFQVRAVPGSALFLPLNVFRLLQPYLSGASASLSNQAYGTDTCPSFGKDGSLHDFGFFVD